MFTALPGEATFPTSLPLQLLTCPGLAEVALESVLQRGGERGWEGQGCGGWGGSPSAATLASHCLPWPPIGLQKGCGACHWK